MVPLKDYDMNSAGESPAMSAEPWEFILWGWMVFFYNYVYDLFTYKSRMAKLQQQKQAVLPHYPNSLICPACLHVIKKN